MPRAKRDPVEEEPVDEQLDQPTETDTLTGAIPEGELELARNLAKRMGWAPKEDWKRDPEGWKDAPDFLEGTVAQVEDLRKKNQELRERSDRTARAAAQAIEDERARKADEATKIIRESDDPKVREAAAQSLREAAGPPPQTMAWMAQNPWFETDPDARRIASTAMLRAHAVGLSIDDQLKAGEDAAKLSFPQYFSAGTEQRLSDVRRQAPNAPQVQEGSRATTTQTREKGWAQIPYADRQAFDLHLLKAYVSKGVSADKAHASYADAYWKEGVLPPNEREEDPWVTTKKANPWVTRGRR